MWHASLRLQFFWWQRSLKTVGFGEFPTLQIQEIMGNAIPETTESHRMSQLAQLCEESDPKDVFAKACIVQQQRLNEEEERQKNLRKDFKPNQFCRSESENRFSV